MRRLALLLTLAAGPAVPSSAGAAPSLVPVGSGWTAPIYVASPPRDTSRLFVVEKGGLVRVMVDAVTQTTPFVDLTGQVATGSEQGLLSIAFPPDYESSGLAYVYLTATGGGELQVRELRRSAADPNRTDGTQRIVWRQTHDQAGNHNGGTIDFGPDGLLWLATGDGGGTNDQFGHAQDPASQLGKVLRIDPRPSGSATYTIPPDNPSGTAVFSIGLRNPFRFSFDRGTGDLLIGDVGQSAREEIDWARFEDGLGRGGNYGWPCFEGFAAGPRTLHSDKLHRADPRLLAARTRRAVAGGVVVARPRPADAARALPVRGHLCRRHPLARPGAAGDRRQFDRPHPNQPGRVRRGRVRPHLRRVDQRDGRAPPGRHARSLRARAGAAAPTGRRCPGRARRHRRPSPRARRRSPTRAGRGCGCG